MEIAEGTTHPTVGPQEARARACACACACVCVCSWYTVSPPTPKMPSSVLLIDFGLLINISLTLLSTLSKASGRIVPRTFALQNKSIEKSKQ